MLIILFAGLSHFSQEKDFRLLGGSLSLEIAWSWWVSLPCQLWDHHQAPSASAWIGQSNGRVPTLVAWDFRKKKKNAIAVGKMYILKVYISWKYTVLELDYGSLIHFWWINLSLFNGLFTWTGPHDFHKSVYTNIIQTWDFKTGHSKSLKFNVHLINRKPIFLLFFIHILKASFLDPLDQVF